MKTDGTPPVGLRNYVASSHEATDLLADRESDVLECLAAVVASLQQGGKLLVAGNGGSAAQAMHLAGEIVGRFQLDRKGLPCICLGTDSATATSILNDYGAEALFARQIEALGRPGDVFLGLTTSGNSPNLLTGFKAAREQGLVCLGWLGRDGGQALGMCDHTVVIPTGNTARIQEAHLILLHFFAERLETALCGEG